MPRKSTSIQSFLWITVPNFGKNNQLYIKTGLFEVLVPKNSLLKSSKSARELESASELDLESELFTRASRERERERACERAGELARSLAKNLKSSSSRSLARRKIEVSQLALARSRKFLPVFCTLTTTIQILQCFRAKSLLKVEKQ